MNSLVVVIDILTRECLAIEPGDDIPPNLGPTPE